MRGLLSSKQKKRLLNGHSSAELGIVVDENSTWL
jgi:hypothetical protein